MGLKQLLQRIIYPTRYSSEALIRHIRSGGGKVGNIVAFSGVVQYLLMIPVYSIYR